ncbi:methylated-DNA--[protein]-cysteine S-methyltransferase [Legionella yabuuchiae]|uniref:methylated-DNA--[protein]-cysteine S-methyltransferase n=1 Tax=Legionella yabuuchiae TaxID=376727 RepID=UPI0010560E08|nr:methylated-DNA--[protein]-cysteine S-methyltransferase [Legionella yabuuchiae]
MTTKLIGSKFNTPVGVLNVIHDEQHIHQSYFCDAIMSGNPQPENGALFAIHQIDGLSTTYTQQIVSELSRYFKNPNYRFQLRLKPQGTSYQKQVWNSLLVIPSGRTLTYGELAHKLQTSPRAIGQACKKNPLTLFIPCHRVIGKANVGGYMGRQEALAYKLALLKHEGKLF